MSFVDNWPPIWISEGWPTVQVRIDRAVRLADDPDLAGWGLVAPSPDEASLVPRVAGLLVGGGLKLPPYEVGWFCPGPLDEHLLTLGGVTFMARRPVAVLIQAGQARHEVIRVLVHEFQHVSDAAYMHLTTPAERETRAQQFEAAWTPLVLRKLGAPRPEPSRGPSAPLSAPTEGSVARYR